MTQTNPFAPLRPALEFITREAKVLPATGQAMEDLMRPDHAEVIDRLRAGGEELYDIIIEAPNRQPYVSLTPVHRTEKHPLRFFLDGSARTFFLGDVVEGDRRSPVHISQIGAAAVFREENGRVRVAKSQHRIVFMMDMKAVSFGEHVKQLVEKAGPRFQFCDFTEDDGETEKTSGKEPRTRSAHKAHHLMAELEDELGRLLSRSPGQWLILDGNLGKDLHRWKDVPNFMSIAKTFSRTPKFEVKAGRSPKTANLYDILSNLQFAQRTCAFAARAGKVAIWYVRIRPQEQLDYPLMGVIKVELPVAGDSVSSDIINEVSAALVAERQVTPHGKDIRWHAHLYSVFLAEQTVKNGFISTEALKVGLKWPVQMRTTVKT